jgi:hypothetical protein
MASLASDIPRRIAMEEVVRFFWPWGEATLPFDAISLADRHPLKVRLGVLRNHVRDVVTQLERGRFVAAAWPTAGHIMLIACHPNTARGSDDMVCLDTGKLPQVVLRLGGWEESRHAAQLLLAAFGGEVIDKEEGRVARFALIDWLLERNQENTAAVIRRYLTFPIYPLGLISRVGLQTAAAMKKLVDAASGLWPLPESVEPSWRRFVVTAVGDDVAFDPDELTQWFTTSGWDAHAAAELTRRFFAEAAFLREYEEEARPA